MTSVAALAEEFDRKAAGQEWCTPQLLFDSLSQEFGGFTLDAAADAQNTKCKKFNSAGEEDKYSWTDERVFCNPPFGKTGVFVMRASWRVAQCVVMILPSSLNSSWFHKHVLKGGAYQIRVPNKRIQFVPPSGVGTSSNSRDTLIAIWDRRYHVPERPQFVPCDSLTGKVL